MSKLHADFVAEQSHSANAATALVASWRRSMMKHRLDPAERRLPARRSDRVLNARRAEMDLLMRIAAPEMDRLFSLVGLSGCNVLLADAEGLIMAERAHEGDAAAFCEWGLSEGFEWSEAAQGTNGIGTSLAERRAVTVLRDEHFHTRNTDMCCAGAPVWGPDGRLIAALDVSSGRRSQPEGHTKLIAAQVVQTAGAIETLLFRATYAGARIVLADPEQGARNALIAVDGDDLTIGATRGARRLLDLPHEGDIRPRPTADLLQRDDDMRGFDKGERAAIARALARSGGNVSAAARALGVGRATLYRRMARLGLDPKQH